MEDHMNTCRLATTAAFAKNVPNFACLPPTPAPNGDIAVYHAQPHGNVDPYGKYVSPDYGIDISSVIEVKQKMLECHESQRGWLDATQKMSSYVQSMLDLGSDLASKFGRKGYLEGWRQRNPLGFGPIGHDPLAAALASYIHRPT